MSFVSSFKENIYSNYELVFTKINHAKRAHDLDTSPGLSVHRTSSLTLLATFFLSLQFNMCQVINTLYTVHCTHVLGYCLGYQRQYCTVHE